ncbi:MAG: hypothetical protein AAGI28_14480 [Pseudomonadota bacterium]
MDAFPLIAQFIGSLAAILALYALATALKLGGQPILKDEDSVRFAASEVEDGFCAESIAIARGSESALTADAEGRIMLIKRHGNRFTGRILDRHARVREEVDAIIVDCGDAQFGEVRLSLDQPSIWVDAINRL